MLFVAASSFVLSAQPVAVRHMEGEVRGFFVLRTEDGATVANGDSIQTVRKGRVVYHLVYAFKDGSLQDETAIFTANHYFRLLTDHLIQKGPTFRHPLDLTVNEPAGQVTVVYTDDKGVQKTESEHMDLPPDLANGIVPFLLQNLAPGMQSITESMVVASPKPMLVKLQIRADGEDQFTTGLVSRRAIRYKVHVDLGGVKGAVAKAVGKQPPDTLVWIFPGDCPAFMRAQGPSFEGGPIWLTELVSPVFANRQGSAARTRE